MKTIQEKAYAKLNLTLDVLDKREDGFHNLSSIMQPISVCDDLELTIGSGEDWKLTCSDAAIPTDAKNLAWKAAEVFYKAAGKDPGGLTIDITKRIPAGGGLGGGSADAAAVLRGLNQLEENFFSQEKLEEIALEIGSDVPFCVRNVTCLAEGRGEKLTPVTPMPSCFYVLVKPEFSVSTPWLYQKIDNVRVPAHPKTEQMLHAMESGDLREIGCQLLNVFEYALLPDHPELFQIENALENCGALGTSMTGSGSVMFGIFANFDFAATASMSLMQVGYQTFMATNV